MCLNVSTLREPLPLKSVSRSRLSRRPRVNSFIRLGLRALAGRKKVFVCIETGRAAGVVGLFGLSRIRFRLGSLEARLPGVKKL